MLDYFRVFNCIQTKSTSKKLSKPGMHNLSTPERQSWRLPNRQTILFLAHFARKALVNTELTYLKKFKNYKLI